jgi:hypothetical protein
MVPSHRYLPGMGKRVGNPTGKGGVVGGRTCILPKLPKPYKLTLFSGGWGWDWGL